jgi:hypothetical protein
MLIAAYAIYRHYYAFRHYADFAIFSPLLRLRSF